MQYICFSPNNNYGEMGSFCKSLKITYAFNNALLNCSIAKEDLSVKKVKGQSEAAV